MACRLFGTKPLPEPMLAYCRLDSWKQISGKFESEFHHFHSGKCIWKCCLPVWRPSCPGGEELTSTRGWCDHLDVSTCSFNSLWPCDAIWHQRLRLWSSLIQIMAYCLFIAKPLTEPIRIHSQWDPQERNKLQWNYNQNINFLLNSRCQMSALLFRPWYLKFLWCWNKNILGKLGQYQGCWQVIIFEEEVFQLPVPWHRKFKYFLFFYTEDGNMYFFMFPKMNSASKGLIYLPGRAGASTEHTSTSTGKSVLE